MTGNEKEVLTPEEAARLWERAAQAAKEAELAKASRVVGESLVQTGADSQDASTGYALEHVRTAALEAGISAEFVDAAVADLRTERSLPALNKETGPVTRRFLGDPPDRITARRTIDAAPREVMTAMETIFANEPYRLTMSERRGDPLDGGLMVFDIQAIANPLVAQGFAAAVREIGLKQAFITLRPIDSTADKTELTLHSPISVHTTGFIVGSILTSICGGAGLAGGLGSGGLLVSVGVTSVVWPVMVVAGTAAGLGLGLKGYRKIYKIAIRNGQEALDGLVGAVAMRAEGGWLS